MGKPSKLENRAAHAATGLAFARIGLLGNPSDAYRGKAIALSLYEFSAEVRLEPMPAHEGFLPPEGLAHDLIAATCARYAREVALPTSHDAYAVRVASTIPFQAGLAGSSAIVIACLRALSTAFDRDLDAFALSEIALAVEVDDLGIAAGPMDRAIQTYEGALHMDFARERSDASYTPVERSRIPPLLVAWDPRGGEASGRVHSDVRERWLRGDAELVAAMREFRELVDIGMEALRTGDAGAFCEVVDRNFDARCELFPVQPRDLEMVALARNQGASAKLCGSGGAVVAVLRDAGDAAPLAAAFANAGYPSCAPAAAPTVHGVPSS
jgi:glucuronokinase